MSLEKPQRIPFETNLQYESRNNNFRINLMESQIAQLQKEMARLKK